ncbi:MAG: 30S ribosomal protein S4 [Patescibacteria group bacterium]
MANNTINTQCKKCRRAGEKLFLKGEKCDSAKCPVVKRNFPPGMHGATARISKPTNYGRQLKEKQKAKRSYGLRELQFRNYFEKALKKVGNTGELLFSFLESRLDNTIYRLGFVSSRRQARQVVGHGLILVNGKKIDIPSYQVKVGDIISIKPNRLKSPLFASLKEKLQKSDKQLVPWISLNKEELSGKILAKPKLNDIAASVDWRIIVEFYSK